MKVLKSFFRNLFREDIKLLGKPFVIFAIGAILFMSIGLFCQVTAIRLTLIKAHQQIEQTQKTTAVPRGDNNTRN